MKQARFSILICFLIFTAIIAYQQCIIQKNDKVLSHEKQLSEKVLILENQLKEKTEENEIYKASMEKKLHPIEAEVQVCMKKGNYTTSVMSKCVLESEDKWNKEIENYLFKLKKVTNPEAYNYILESQEKWIKYRDIQRKVIYNTVSNLQGTMYINISDGMNVDITQNRAMWLYSLFDILEKESHVK